MRFTFMCRWVLALAILAAPAASLAQRLAPDQAIPPAELEAFVDGIVRPAMDRDHIAGVSVSVVQDGKVVLKKGYGYADVDAARPVDPDATLFRIGSITKTFTWLMAMDAVADGRMSLDAPINAYLPPYVRIPGEGLRRQVRLRDLVTHTPGFEELIFKDLFIRDPARLQPLDAYLATHRPARIWEPGTVSAYSNYGAALAGYAVGRVRGQPWQDLLERRILGPAGMTRTTGREPYPARAGLPAPMAADLAGGLSKGYRWTGVAFAAQPFEHVNGAPAGAISSTAGDMARYMRLRLGNGVIDGRAVYGPATAALATTPLLTFPGGAAADGAIFQSPVRGGFTAFGHNGATLDFSANMNLVPAVRLGVFVAANTESGQTLTGALPWLVVEHFYSPPKVAPRPAPELLRQAAIYGGEFITTRRPFHGLEAFAMGFRPTPVAVAAPGYLLIGGQRFVPAGAAGLFLNVDYPPSLMRVVMANGRAEKLISSGGELWRRDWVHQTQTLAIAALAAALAAVAVLAGLVSPARWRAPQTGVQRLVGMLRAPAAALWLLAIAAFAVLLTRALADNSTVIYGWPGPLMLTASIAGLLAAALSWTVLALTPFAWAGAGGWTLARKLRLTATALVFSAFGLLLAFLGALQPWNP
jgi:CubicO group peptidase (beta-lactamase class C family)